MWLHFRVLALTNMRPNHVIATLVLGAGVVLLRLLSKSNAAAEQSRIRNWIPALALVFGPVIGIAWWAADVFLLNVDCYVLPSDSKAALISHSLVGSFVGLVAAVVLAVSLLISRSGRGS